jgi:excinuclease UvrABC ATPase subunit
VIKTADWVLDLGLEGGNTTTEEKSAGRRFHT